MTHSGSCANAKGTECACKCNGVLHGIGPKGKRWHHLKKGHRYLCTAMGGKVEQMIEQFLGKKFSCTCDRTTKIKEFIGGRGEPGHPDKEGKKWWIYIKCQHCGRDWQIEKIPISTS